MVIKENLIFGTPPNPRTPLVPPGNPKPSGTITANLRLPIPARSYQASVRIDPTRPEARRDTELAARQMCTRRTLERMCSPGTLTWGLGEGVLGVFWDCSGGCSRGVLGVFWDCSGGILGGSLQNTPRTGPEHSQNTPGTPPRTPPKQSQNTPPPTPKFASRGDTSELSSWGYTSGGRK